MIIVSQNKEQIINLDNVTRIFIEDFSEDGDGFGIGADTNSAENQCWDLGYYKTEERAKEVLQEIIKAYKGKCLIQFQGNLQNEKIEELNKKYENDAIYYDLKTEIKQVTNSIYVMPKE